MPAPHLSLLLILSIVPDVLKLAEDAVADLSDGKLSAEETAQLGADILKIVEDVKGKAGAPVTLTGAEFTERIDCATRLNTGDVLAALPAIVGLIEEILRDVKDRKLTAAEVAAIGEKALGVFKAVFGG